jgi:hypothetical protein
MDLFDARGNGGDMAPLPLTLAKAAAVKGHTLDAVPAEGRHHLVKPSRVAFYTMEKNYQVLA